MKRIIALLLALTMIIALCACGGNSEEKATVETTSDNSTSRLEKLMEAEKEKQAKAEAEKQKQEEESKAEEERQEEERKRLRAEVTTNDELLDALVGEWGYLVPSYPAVSGRISDACLSYLYFGEYGGGTMMLAYDDVNDGNKRDLWRTSLYHFEHAFDVTSN